MELIEIKVRNGINVVSGRDLHEFLEVETRSDHWINRLIEKYDFVEGEEWRAYVQKRPHASGRDYEQTDNLLMIDTAKEISMVQNNEKGKQARRYFIEVEKGRQSQLTSIEIIHRDNFTSLQRKCEIQERKISFMERQLNDIQKFITWQKKDQEVRERVENEKHAEMKRLVELFLH
ncbi:MAG: antA/AntB antirepressor family protein [Turicibacter sp.]|nr:antA/AntB antirepressor family protein [Turicibacter sp.]